MPLPDRVSVATLPFTLCPLPFAHKYGRKRVGEKSLTTSFICEDLRSWLAEAERMNEVAKVEGATWQEDIGMAAEVVNHSETAQRKSGFLLKGGKSQVVPQFENDRD